MNEAQKQAVLAAIGIIVETVEEMGELGAPEGPMYAALMGAGISLDQFNQLVALAVKTGKIRKSGHVLYPVINKY